MGGGGRDLFEIFSSTSQILLCWKTRGKIWNKSIIALKCIYTRSITFVWQKYRACYQYLTVHPMFNHLASQWNLYKLITGSAVWYLLLCLLWQVIRVCYSFRKCFFGQCLIVHSLLIRREKKLVKLCSLWQARQTTKRQKCLKLSTREKNVTWRNAGKNVTVHVGREYT